MSTLDAVTANVKSAANSAAAVVTGDPAHNDAAAEQKREANVHKDVSNAGTSVGGVSISASGTAKNDERRQEGSWNQTVGSAKEAVGGLVSDDLKAQGQRQRTQGEATEAAGQASDGVQGATQRVVGKVQEAIAPQGSQAEQDAKAKHDEGKTLLRGVQSETK